MLQPTHQRPVYQSPYCCIMVRCCTVLMCPLKGNTLYTSPVQYTLITVMFDYSSRKQELSYRKQIARQLRTQFVEGISVTLKSTFRVTQGHWKQNHWTDHTRLTVRRVIERWILSWPWNVGQRSLKVIESGTVWMFGYGFLTFPTLTLTITITLTLTLTLTLGLGVKVIENGAVR